MKKLFFWRLRPSDAFFEELWENATFVFDTNFLLDLYRVSRSTAEEFLQVLEKIKDRIWLPYQVADEFFAQREGVIASEAASFQKALRKLEEWKNKQQQFGNLKGLLDEAGKIVAAEVSALFENQDLQTIYSSALDAVEKDFRATIEELAKTHSSLNAEEDFVLEKLLPLFDEKVGQPYSKADLEKLYKEGDARYSQLKPPGFKDAEKKDHHKYGDFILWQQILDFAKERSRPIILVTRDRKEDWWIKNDKKEIIFPHFELRREFNDYVGLPFWMYQTQSFLNTAKEKLLVNIAPGSIEEIDVIADTESLEDEVSVDVIEQAQTYAYEPKQAINRLNLADARLKKAMSLAESSLEKAIPAEVFSSLSERLVGQGAILDSITQNLATKDLARLIGSGLLTQNLATKDLAELMGSTGFLTKQIFEQLFEQPDLTQHVFRQAVSMEVANSLAGRMFQQTEMFNSVGRSAVEAMQSLGINNIPHPLVQTQENVSRVNKDRDENEETEPTLKKSTPPKRRKKNVSE